MDQQYFSKEGLEKLKKELEERENVIRPQIAVRIKEAKEHGDLSENAEFDSAKESQSMNEGRIEELRGLLENAVIIENGHSKGIVVVGSSVKVESPHGTQTFVIVGASESQPEDGFISNESPIGQSFLGKKKGEVAEVKTPKGKVQYKILEIK